MPISFTCPYCRTAMTVTEDRGGTAATCPSCHRPLILPVVPAAPGAGAAQQPAPTPSPYQQAPQQTWTPTSPPAPVAPPAQAATPAPTAPPVASRRRPRLVRGGAGKSWAAFVFGIVAVLALAGGFYAYRSGALEKLTTRAPATRRSRPGLAVVGHRSVGTRYDGEWDSEEEIGPSFHVEDGKISVVSAPLIGGAEDLGGGKVRLSVNAWHITTIPASEGQIAGDGSFNITMDPGHPFPRTITLEGKFTSATGAEGVYAQQGIKVPWTATKESG